MISGKKFLPLRIRLLYAAFLSFEKIPRQGTRIGQILDELQSFFFDLDHCFFPFIGFENTASQAQYSKIRFFVKGKERWNQAGAQIADAKFKSKPATHYQSAPQ